jgi:hypothetical protein
VLPVSPRVSSVVRGSAKCRTVFPISTGPSFAASRWRESPSGNGRLHRLMRYATSAARSVAEIVVPNS